MVLNPVDKAVKDWYAARLEKERLAAELAQKEQEFIAANVAERDAFAAVQAAFALKPPPGYREVEA